MSSIVDQTELQKEVEAPATVTDPGDTAILSGEAPADGAGDPKHEESKEFATQSGDVQSNDADASKPDDKLTKSNEASDADPKANEGDTSYESGDVQLNNAEASELIRSNNSDDSDPKADEPKGDTVESNETGSDSKQLKKDEGSRTFTMRELLDELKNGDANEDSEAERRESDTPHSQQSSQQHTESNAALELINSVTGADEEGRSRQRILTYAARRYATALERNQEDYDALYNWALVLQESADNVSPDSTSPSKDSLLEQACKKYEEATRLCPTLNDAYYNWAIAISDRAKIRGRTKEAEELWKQATKNYEKAVQLNWNSPQALNNWAGTKYVSSVGWDGQLVNESYVWVENKVAFQPPVRQWQSAVRDGLVESGVVPYNGFTYDHINGTKIGGTIFDAAGRRHTAADLLEYANPSGITLLLHATVHKIIFQTRGLSRPKAHGVIFRDALGKKHTAYLRRGEMNEVIVSSGALGSPQMLMLSGVGPSEHLKAHNITVVLDQPNVGQNMMDNPMNAIFVPSPLPVEVSLIQVVGITRFGTYIEAASGENFSGYRSSRSDYGMFSPKIGQLSTVPPKQRTPEALEKAINSMNALDAAAFRGGFILEKIMGPISTGHLELRTRNPNDNPSVTFNYFKEPEDLQRCVDGLKIIENIIESKSFSQFRYDSISLPALLNLTASAPVNLLPKHDNISVSLEQFCKDTVMTIWHYHGGCQVGNVVDQDYKVIGVDNLRVIDGSTFNYSPGTNPQATVMMLGRYMGVRIVNERLAKEESN